MFDDAEEMAGRGIRDDPPLSSNTACESARPVTAAHGAGFVTGNNCRTILGLGILVLVGAFVCPAARLPRSNNNNGENSTNIRTSLEPNDRPLPR